MDFSNLIEFVQDHRFSFISWATTGLVVVALLGSTLWWTQRGSASPATQPQPTAAPDQHPSVGLPTSLNNAGRSTGNWPGTATEDQPERANQS